MYLHQPGGDKRRRHPRGAGRGQDAHGRIGGGSRGI